MSMFTLQARPPKHPTFAFTDAPVEIAFTEKYRPRSLSEMTGNLECLDRLRKFLTRPHSRSFLFVGDTGTGKTTAALALAHDLGCSEFSGLQVVRSGELDAETFARVLGACRYTPFPMPGSKGWHCVVFEESDMASAKAKYLMLSALEDLPPRTVFVFTSNHADKFEQRFLDRCDRLDFSADIEVALDAAQILSDHIWHAETGGEDGPDVNTLPNVVLKGKLSFRRLVSALESLIKFGC